MRDTRAMPSYLPSMVRSTATHATSLTLEEWGELPEDEPGELVDGRLEEEEMTTRVHEAAVVWLLYELEGWARRSGAAVYGSELKLAVTPHRGRKPDVNVFFSGSRRSPAQSTVQQHPPDLVIEVISPRPSDARRDRVDKPDDYALAGVRHYWIVDPQLRSFETLERDAAGRYVRAMAASQGTIAPEGLPGLTLDLDSLWLRVERELELGSD